jgi:transcriptional regulator with XRE-family HTH domain
MTAANSTFAERLNEAFKYRGITDTQEKIKRLEDATGRKARTVAGWLNGDGIPRSGLTLVQIGEDLNAGIDWLLLGDGYSPFQRDMQEKLSGVPPHMLNGLIRYMLRLMNNDPKALRWTAMRERGELSAEQLLSMA